MPEPIAAPAGQPNPAPTDAPKVESFLMPEKFSGKSAEEIAKSYTELEKKLGTYSDYDAYAKIGKPDEITEALTWARNVKSAMDKGLLTPAEAKKAVKEGPSHVSSTEPDEPWSAEDWAYKPASEQAKAMSEYTRAQTKAYIDQIAADYGKQIQGLAGKDGREKSILIKALKTAIKNPSIDPEELLQEAAELSAKSPEELIDMVMDRRGNTPESRKTEIERLVAEGVAEAMSKKEASELASLTSAATPRRTSLGLKAPNREAENRSIIESLGKQGIRLI